MTTNAVPPVEPSFEPDPIAKAASDRIEAEQRVRQQSQFKAALQEDSDLAARSYTLARQIGADPQTVADNYEVADRLRKEITAEHIRATKAYPATSQMLQDVWFAKAAHPELDKLQETEGLLSQIGSVAAWPFKQFWTGPQQFELGGYGLALAYQERNGKLADPSTLAALRELDAKLEGQGQGWIAGLLNVTGQIATVGLASAGVGAAASTVTTPFGGVIAAGTTAFSMNSAQAAGQTYWNLRQQGVPPDLAFQYASISGVGQGALETISQIIGAKFAGKVVGSVTGKELLAGVSVKAARANFVKEAAKALAAEVATEVGQTTVDWAAQQEAFRASGFDTPDQWKDLRGQVLDTAWQTIQATALLSGLGAYAGHMGQLRYASRVEARAAALEKLGESIKGTALAEKAPDLHDRFLQTAAKEHSVETMYVDGEEMLKLYKQLDPDEQAKLEEKLPGIKDKIESAVTASGDVDLPTAKVVRATPKLFDALKEHIRFDPEEPSFADVKKALADSADEMKRLDAEITRTTEDEAKAQKQLKVIEDSLAEQFAKAGRKKGEARADAQLWTKILDVASKRARKPPEEMAKTFPLKAQAGEASPGQMASTGRGSFSPKEWLIRLHKADASTAAHEIFHGALEMHRSLAANPETGAAFRSVLEPLAKANNLTVDEVLNLDATKWEALHEKTAKQWETYLATGKAPTPELHSLFVRFMSWLRDLVLRGVIDRGELQPETRQFFDTLLATDGELALAQAQRNLSDTYFADRKTFEGTDEDWAEVENAREVLASSSLAELAAGSLKGTKFVKNLLEKIDNKFAREEKARRADATARAKDEVTSRPVVMLRSWFDESTKKKPHKISTEEVRETMGLAAHDVLTELEGYHTSEGEYVPLDDLAHDYGYKSGEEMLTDLYTTPATDELIATRADEILRDEDPEFFDKQAREDLTLTAIHDEARTKLAATVIRVLQKEKKPGRIGRAVIAETARARLENTEVGSLDPRIFSRMAGKAHQKALTALREGKADDAVVALRHEMLNNEMARRAVALRREVESKERSWSRFFESDKTIARTRNLDIVNAGRAILAQFGVGTSRAPESFLAALETYRPDVYLRMKATIDRATEAATDKGVKGLTLTEFRHLDAALDSLWDSARSDKYLTIKGKAIERTEAANELLVAAAEVRGQQTVPQGPLSEEDRKKSKSSDLLNRFKIVEHVAFKLDGGKLDGPWSRYVVQPVFEAYNKFLERRTILGKEANDDLRKIEGTLRRTGIAANKDGEIGHVFENGAQLLAFLQHIGNYENKRIALLGFGWANEVIDPTTKEAVLDSSKWDRTFKRMVDDGTITEQMLDYVQRAWDRNESLKAEAQATHKELHDTYFKEVSAQAFTVRFPSGKEKTYTGGYIPAPRDLDHPVNQGIGLTNEEDVLKLQEATAKDILGGLPGFVRERTGGTGPLRLDLSDHVRHLDQVLRFIHMQVPFRDTIMLLREKNIAAFLKSADPAFVSQLIEPWLIDTFNNRISKPSWLGRKIGEIANFLRRSVGLQVLGGSVVNSLQQATGISNISLYVKDHSIIRSNVRNVLKGTGTDTAWGTAIAKSAEMRLRLVHHIGQVDEDLNMLLQPSKVQEIQKWFSESIFGYWGQRAVQSRVDVIAWHSGYDQALRAGKSEAEAIAEGDSVVRLSQGSHTPAGLAAFQRGTPEMKLLFQFGGYSTLVLNQITSGQGKLGMLRNALPALIVPTLVSSAFVAAASWGHVWDDKDHDGSLDDFSWWLFKSYVRAAGGLVPVIGPIASQALVSGKHAGDRVSIAPFETQLETAGRLLGLGQSALTADQTKFGGQQLRDIVSTLGVATGLPLRWLGDAVGFYIDANNFQRRQPPTPQNLMDWVAGLSGGYR